MTIKTLTTASIAALVLGSGAAMADTWRYAFEEALDEVQGVYAQKFKEEVEANSDHEVQLFPFGTLGESDNIMEQTQSGILQFVNQSPGFTGSLIPEAQVFFVPYLLPQDEETLATFFRDSKAINEIFPELYAEQGLELLKMYPEGEVMLTTTPTRRPAITAPPIDPMPPTTVTTNASARMVAPISGITPCSGAASRPARRRQRT